MNNAPVEILKTPIQPMACINEGWALIKDQYWLFLGITFVGMMIGSASMYICLGPMMCGIFIALLAKMRGEKVEFNTLFKGFDVFLPSLGPTLIMIAIGCILIVPFYFMMIFELMKMEDAAPTAEFPAELMLSMSLMMGGAMLMNVFYFFLFFCFQLIGDRRAKGMASMGLSAKGVCKNFWGVLGLSLLLGIFATLATACTCYIGGIFFLPIMYAAMAVAYVKVFPVEPPSLPVVEPVA